MTEALMTAAQTGPLFPDYGVNRTRHDATHDEISQTIQRADPQQYGPRRPALLVVGSGDSADALANPRLITIGESLEIGRRPVATDDQKALVLSDRTVSGRHARVRWVPAAAEPFLIEDLGSMNGTYVDGRRIDGVAALRDGALVFLGSHVLVFRLIAPAGLEAIRLDMSHPFAPLPTLSPALALASAKLRLLAPSNTEILLVGETGVGKEVFAHAIHTASGRSGQFVAVNCAAIPAALIESELFGYEKGAHSTAHGRKPGLVDAAAGGTLFLDEIGDMHVDLQSKLLRFVQDRCFTPLGSTRAIQADVRIIAATSRTVVGPRAHVQEAMVARLGAQPITLPPLRDRVEDIGRLALHFLEQSGGHAARAGHGPAVPIFEPDAFQALLLHRWPLNVRELSKVVNEAAILGRDRAIGIEDLPEPVTGGLRIGDGRCQDLDASINPVGIPAAGGANSRTDTAPGTSLERERLRIVEALALCAGNQSRAARLLAMSRRVLLTRLDRYSIPRPQKGTGNE